MKVAMVYGPGKIGVEAVVYGLPLVVMDLTKRVSTNVPGPQPNAHAPLNQFGSMLEYPPVDPGISVRSIDDVLAAQHDLIRRIKLCYGANRETFDTDLFSLIRRYAEYVHLLPATPDNHFSLPGGLLRMGLEVAFYALQATDGQIFSGRSTISHRRQLEPRWRHATFIAGLCSELHRTLSHVTVLDAKGNEWPAYLYPLTRWLREQCVLRFFLRWIPHAQETRSLGVFALPQIVSSPGSERALGLSPTPMLIVDEARPVRERGWAR